MSVFFGIDFDTIAADAAVNSLQQGFAATLTGAIAKAEARAFVMADKTAKSLLTIGDDLRWVARNAAEIDLALGGDSLDQANARLARTKDTLAAAKVEAEKLAEAIKQEQAAIGGMDASKIKSLGAALSEARKKETAALHAYNAAQRAVTSEAAKAEATQRAAAQAAAEDLRRQQAAADSLGLSVRELRQQATQVDFSLGADTLEAAKARVDAFKAALEQAKTEARAVAAEVARTDATQLSTKDAETLALRAKAAKEQETRALQAYSQAQRDVQSHESKRAQQETLAIQRSQRLFGALNELRGMFGDLRDVFEITGQALLGFSDKQQAAAEHMAYSAEKGAMLGLASAELGERLGLSAKNALLLGGALGTLGTVATFVLSAYSEYVKQAKEATDALRAVRADLADAESDYARELLINGKASVELLNERVALIYKEQEAQRAAAEANRGFWRATSETAAETVLWLDRVTGGWADLGAAQAEATLAARDYDLTQQAIIAGARGQEKMRDLWRDTAGAIELSQKEIGNTWIALSDLGREKSLKELGEDAKAARDRLSDVSDNLAGLKATLNRPAPSEFGAALLDQFEKMRILTVFFPKAQKELAEATREATSTESAYQSKKKQGETEAKRAAAERKKERDEKAKEEAKAAKEYAELQAENAQAARDLWRDEREHIGVMGQGVLAAPIFAAIEARAELDSLGPVRLNFEPDEAERAASAVDKIAAGIARAKSLTESLGESIRTELIGGFADVAQKAAGDLFDALASGEKRSVQERRAALAAYAKDALKASAVKLVGQAAEHGGQGAALIATGLVPSGTALLGVALKELAAAAAFGAGGAIAGRIGGLLGGGRGRGGRAREESAGGSLGGGSRISGVREAARGPVAPTVIQVTVQSLVPADQGALEQAGAAISSALAAHARSGA